MQYIHTHTHTQRWGNKLLCMVNSELHTYVGTQVQYGHPPPGRHSTQTHRQRCRWNPTTPNGPGADLVSDNWQARGAVRATILPPVVSQPCTTPTMIVSDRCTIGLLLSVIGPIEDFLELLGKGPLCGAREKKKKKKERWSMGSRVDKFSTYGAVVSW